MLRPIIRRWWEANGKPQDGLLFPALIDGKHSDAGEGEKHKVSHAKAFRRDLRRAFGIDRLENVEIKRKNGRNMGAECWVEVRKMNQRERELLIVEDSPYSLLRYEGEALPTLRTLDGGRYVIYLGTFSKILAAGLRIGWLIAPHPLMQKMTIGKQGADLNSSSVSQIVIEACLGDLHAWRAYMVQVRERYRRRRDVMLEAMQASNDCAPAFPALASTQICTSGVRVAQLMKSLPRARRSRPPL